MKKSPDIDCRLIHLGVRDPASVKKYTPHLTCSGHVESMVELGDRMLTDIHPKLPMRNKQTTLNFYVDRLGFLPFGSLDHSGYLMLQKEMIQIHFFEFAQLDPSQNYGQVYIRSNDIEHSYQEFLARNVAIHPDGQLETKPWGQKEFSILDPDNNLLTFGQALAT